MNEINTLTADSNKNNKAYKIYIYSFSNEEKEGIVFPAFLKDFSDSYKSDWNSQRVLGKMDPIATFKNTIRTISFNFDVPSESLGEAKENLSKIDYIIRGQYPVYDSGELGTSVLSSPPYFRVRFSNLIRNAANENDGPNNTLRSGLMCYFTGFDFKPNTSSGYFVENGNLYPKLIEVSLALNVIHEHPLGKKEINGTLSSRDGFKKFPRLDPEAAKKLQNAALAPTTPPPLPAPAATVGVPPLLAAPAPINNNTVAQTQGKELQALNNKPPMAAAENKDWKPW